MSRCSLILAIYFLLTISAAAQHALPADTFKIIHTYPHDANAFTQGLIYQDGHLYESTGLNGKSSVRIVDLPSGRVLKQYDLAAKYFGEGLTSWGDELIQLTWQSELGFVYDRATLAWKKSFAYKGEGWGLTHDDQQLILSDGTPTLRFLDPKSFVEKRRVTVTDEKGPACRGRERTRVHSRRSLCQHLADGRDHSHFTADGKNIGTNRFDRLDRQIGTRGFRCGLERNCLRCENGSALRDRKALAKIVRDQSSASQPSAKIARQSKRAAVSCGPWQIRKKLRIGSLYGNCRNQAVEREPSWCCPRRRRCWLDWWLGIRLQSPERLCRQSKLPPSTWC